MSADLQRTVGRPLDTTASQIQSSQDPVDLIESAKRAAARRAVDDYFDVNMHYVGIGSGTTIQYVVEAIKEKAADKNILFIPTGFQSRTEIEKRGLISIPFDSLPAHTVLDVAFDGADEVDEEFNCVKGGGACLFQEKLVAMRAKKFVCVAGQLFRGLKDVQSQGLTMPRLSTRLSQGRYEITHGMAIHSDRGYTNCIEDSAEGAYRTGMSAAFIADFG